jgi:3-dehydroquinate dehydratase-1
LKAKTLRIGQVALRPQHPIVIVPVTDRTGAAALRAAARQGVALAEARVDLFRDRSAARVARFLAATRRVMPVLLTVRAAAEGGAFEDDEPTRLALYRALLPHADAVDVELSAAIRPALVRDARKSRRLIVLSHHDFRRTPPDPELDRVVARGFRAGADIVKLATHVRDDRDTARLAGLLSRHSGQPLVVIGMGEHGKKTRVLFPALGSLFTFAALGRGTAPGQLDVATMRRELSLFFPDFAQG